MRIESSWNGEKVEWTEKEKAIKIVNRERREEPFKEVNMKVKWKPFLRRIPMTHI